MKKVPKKNVEAILVDVKKPDYNYKRVPRVETVNLMRVPKAPLRSFHGFKKTFVLVASALFLLLATFSFFAFSRADDLKTVFAKSAASVAQNFSVSADALRSFEPDKASLVLEENGKELTALNDIFKKNFGQMLTSLLGNIVPAFKGAATLLGDVTSLNADLLSLTDKVAKLEQNGMRDFQSDGAALVTSITDIHNLILSLNKKMEAMRNTTAEFKGISPLFGQLDGFLSGGYLKYSGQIHELDQFLGGVLALLQSGGEQHVALLFQNVAEVRPGGGFVGSYADLTIENGQLKNIDVHDIYDPDGQLDLKVVPPTEIKTMSRNWGARDANWFFDFPTSAKTILYFLENSKMYSEKGIIFDGVIGMNINVFQSILDVTGSIPLPDYNLVITSDNFLNEIQREVETGADKQAGEPKRILKVLAPLVLERLKGMVDWQVRSLVEALRRHIAQKDILIYMKNPAIANFVAKSAADGSVYQLPNGFWGNYLAVVDANIAGGKTDVHINQSVDARIDVDTNGNTFTDLSIVRTHTGNTQKDPWWRVTNKNFLQVFANPNSSLVSVAGNDVKNLFSTYNYDANGYLRLPELQNIEDTSVYSSIYRTWTMRAFGKTVFGMWSFLPAGQTETIAVRYQTPGGDRPDVTAGSVYSFIYERQSGVRTKLEITFSAPLGFIWKESGTPIYTYTNDDPDGRVQFVLTLAKSN